MALPQLRRVRWAVRATLALGVAASVIANVLHARDNPISQAIAAWPPLALLLTVELISRVPVHGRALAVARLVATATIAGIAAWVSYWHMAGVAARYGEVGASPYLLPLSVDGLIVVASICLVELGGRIAASQPAERPSATAAGGPARPGHTGSPVGAARREPGPATLANPPGPAPAVPVGIPPTPASATAGGVGGTQPAAAVRAGEPQDAAAPTVDWALIRDQARAVELAASRSAALADGPAQASVGTPATSARAAASGPKATSRTARPPRQTGVTPAGTKTGTPKTTTGKATGPAKMAGTGKAPGTTKRTGTTKGTGTAGPAGPAPPTARPRRPMAETVALAAKIEADRPDVTEIDLARELGISTARLRAVRRAARTQDLELAA